MSSAADDRMTLSQPMRLLPEDAIVDGVRGVVTQRLAPYVARYDREGIYPEEAMRGFGSTGLYGTHLSGQGDSPDVDMISMIEGMSVVSGSCLSTGFCVWCQAACGWYLEHTENEGLREKLKPIVATGERLGGTGLSNPMKFYSGIESIRLRGKRVAGGYEVTGALPWVSNLGSDHLFGIVFAVEGKEDHRVMAMIDCAQEGVVLGDGGRMIALEGSRTFSIRFKQCFVSDEQILADPADEYVAKIRPGFVLMQVGMGLGLVESCIEGMRRLEGRLGHVNRFLDDGPDALTEELEAARQNARELASTPDDDSPAYSKACFEARLAGGELALRAATSEMLHAGARAYLANSDTFRRLREAYFVAVVTPATKHLRKQIAALA
jgi:alkylation response protein AidB-like acyl-CoA dehydrogenase